MIVKFRISLIFLNLIVAIFMLLFTGFENLRVFVGITPGLLFVVDAFFMLSFALFAKKLWLKIFIINSGFFILFSIVAFVFMAIKKHFILFDNSFEIYFYFISIFNYIFLMVLDFVKTK